MLTFGKLIENRRQLLMEPFSDLSMEIQSLLIRLRKAVDEIQTVEILRRNMSIRYREALFMH